MGKEKLKPAGVSEQEWEIRRRCSITEMRVVIRECEAQVEDIKRDSARRIKIIRDRQKYIQEQLAKEAK